jgi:hypothetical protein
MMDLQKMVCGGMEWIELAQDTIVNAVMNIRFP